MAESAWPIEYNALPTNIGAKTSARSGTPLPDGTAGYHAELHNLEDAAISALEHSLGIKPEGKYKTVRERLEAIEAAGGAKALEEEIASRVAADNGLAAAIGNEIAAREVDVGLEETRAKEAEAALKDEVKAERERAEAAEALLPVRSVLAADLKLAKESTAFQDLSGLAFEVPASATGVYEFAFKLGIECLNETHKLKFQFAALPTGATMRWGAVGNSASTNAWGGVATTSNPLNLLTATQELKLGSRGGVVGVLISGKVFCGTKAGTVQLRAGTVAADPGQPIVLRGADVKRELLIP